MKYNILLGVLALTSIVAACSNVNEKDVEEQKKTIELGKGLISKSDCNSCHQLETKIIGPSYLDIAQKYENNSKNIQTLADKIISGGSGSWGNIPMLPHADLEDHEAKAMAFYILSLLNKE